MQQKSKGTKKQMREKVQYEEKTMKEQQLGVVPQATAAPKHIHKATELLCYVAMHNNCTSQAH